MAEVRQLSSEGLETGRPLTQKLRMAWLWICLSACRWAQGAMKPAASLWLCGAHTPQPGLPLTDSQASAPAGPVFPHGFPLSLQTALPPCTLSPTSTQRAPITHL